MITLTLNWEQITILKEAFNRARQLPELESRTYDIHPTSGDALFEHMLKAIEDEIDELQAEAEGMKIL